MLRTTQLRFVAIALFAVAAASLTTTSARAFSQGNGGTSGSDNTSSFGDPDEQIGKMFGMSQGEESSSSLGSPAKVDPKSNPYKHFQPDTLTSTPNPFPPHN
jgi:hypothetical protein